MQIWSLQPFRLFVLRGGSAWDAYVGQGSESIVVTVVDLARCTEVVNEMLRLWSIQLTNGILRWP